MARRGWFECPECGAQVREGRLSCPECGSDAETGWKDDEEIQYQSIDLPDEQWDEELRERSASGPKTWLIVVALVAVLAFVIAAVNW